MLHNEEPHRFLIMDCPIFHVSIRAQAGYALGSARTQVLSCYATLPVAAAVGSEAEQMCALVQLLVQRKLSELLEAWHSVKVARRSGYGESCQLLAIVGV